MRAQKVDRWLIGIRVAYFHLDIQSTWETSNILDHNVVMKVPPFFIQIAVFRHARDLVTRQDPVSRKFSYFIRHKGSMLER